MDYERRSRIALCTVLGRLPARFQGLEVQFGEVCAVHLRGRLHMPEPCLEFAICGCQRILRIDLEMAGKVDHGQQQVPDFFLDVVVLAEPDR